MTTAAAPAPREAPWRRLSARMLLVNPVQEVVRAAPALLGLADRRQQQRPRRPVGPRRRRDRDRRGHAALVHDELPDHARAGPGPPRAPAPPAARGLARPRADVDVSANPLQRVLGLVRVTVGTGRSERGADGGLRLDGLDASRRGGLRDSCCTTGPAGGRQRRGRRARRTTPATRSPRPPPPSPAPRRPRPSRAPAPGVAALRAVHALGRAHGRRHRPGSCSTPPTTRTSTRATSVRSATRRRARRHAGRGPRIVAGCSRVVVLVALFSTAGYRLAFWGYRLTRHPGGTIHVTRGLLSTRATTIEERRLRGVELSQPLLLRWAGGARCDAIATGLRDRPRRRARRLALFPPGPRGGPAASPARCCAPATR